MPVINQGAGGPNGPQQQRTSSRPPWVKDGPQPIPLPTAPWTLARTRQRASDAQETGLPMPNLKPVPRKNSASNSVPAENSSGPSGAAKPESAPVRKTSKITIIPSKPSVDGATPKENGHDVSSVATNSKPNSRTQQAAAEEPKPSKAPQVKQIPIEIKSTSKPKQEEQKQKSSVKQQEEPKSKSTNKQQEEPKKSNKVESKPPQPPAPPMPPPPPMPGLGNKQPLPAVKVEKLDALRNRPRKRPDWGALMKEVEGGSRRKLKHVQCNDRSSPLIPKIKVKDGFMYESEKPNVHHQLLKEIQGGVSLKKVRTNDRSKPQLDGLRKFRRQLTIEEQIQKAETSEEVEVEPDELDDIDKVRDDLQSTKQMLALELRNKEAMERENKKLLTRILNLEVELEKERAAKRSTEERSPQARREEDEQEKKKLKKDLEEAQKAAEDMETKYHDTAGLLDMAKTDLEEAVRKNQVLERKLQAAILNQAEELPLRKQPSAKKLASLAPAKESNANMPQAAGQQAKEEEDEESEYEEVTETETETSEDEEEDTEALRERRTARELKLLATKLKSFKEKEDIARKERHALRDQLKKQQKILKEEKKKYKELQKEVDKMANLMKEDEEEESEEEEVEESESESDSESEESEEEESDGDLPPDAPAENRKQNFTERAKRHENCLAALRKGNYMLKANIDRLKDELFKQKEMSLSLQEDLNSVLAELG